MATQPSADSKGSSPSVVEQSPEAEDLEGETIVGAKPRILYVLGEKNASGAEDITEVARAEASNVLGGGAFSELWEPVFRPLGAWSYGIHQRVRDLYLIDDAASAQGLRNVHIMTVGKSGRTDAEAARSIIERTQPDLIVASGAETVYWPLVGRLELGHELLTKAYDEPVYYSILEMGDYRSILLHFWHPSHGYYTKGGHHHIFKLFLHAYDALCRKRLLTCP